MAESTGVAALIAPVIAQRHPDMPLADVEAAAERFARIGVDVESLRYQIEHGMLQVRRG